VNEFRINNYLTLKIEGARTVIYVVGDRFRHCKFLLLSIPINKMKPLEDLESIDEVADLFEELSLSKISGSPRK